MSNSRTTQTMLTGEEGALLAAIRADPWYDLPRLVYADYLDDRGESVRAAGIRLMCRFPKAASWVYRPPSGRRAIAPPTWAVEPNRGLPGRAGRLRGWADAVRRTLPSPAGYPARSGFTLRRGFVTEVRVSLAAFLGGECRRCTGVESRTDRLGRVWLCRPCLCRGHFEAVVRSLLASYPIERVALTDKYPQLGWDGDARWGWWEDEGDGPSYLPAAVFRLLPADAEYAEGTPLRRSYATDDDARAALSVALLTFGMTPASRV